MPDARRGGVPIRDAEQKNTDLCVLSDESRDKNRCFGGSN